MMYSNVKQTSEYLVFINNWTECNHLETSNRLESLRTRSAQSSSGAGVWVKQNYIYWKYKMCTQNRIHVP